MAINWGDLGAGGLGGEGAHQSRKAIRGAAGRLHPDLQARQGPPG